MAQEILCPIDNNKMHLWINVAGDQKRPSEKDSYQLYWCDCCHYGMLYPRPTQPQDCLKFYDVEDGTYYTHHKPTDKVNNQTQINFFDKLRLHLSWRLDQGTQINGAFINELIKGKGAICDIGCGNGSLLLDCKNFGHSVWGVEPDVKARRVAQSRGLIVEEGTAENLPETIKKCAFDVVIATHVIEHCLAPMCSLTNIREILKPGGFFIVEVPNNQCIAAKWTGAAWNHLDAPRHLNFFTEASLAKFLQKAGFKIISTGYKGYCRQFQNQTIELQKRLYEFLDSRSGHDSLKIKPSAVASWLMLLSSALAPASTKYDAVWAIAQKVQD